MPINASRTHSKRPIYLKLSGVASIGQAIFIRTRRTSPYPARECQLQW